MKYIALEDFADYCGVRGKLEICADDSKMELSAFDGWLCVLRANAAQLARIFAHYAETGELCEAPPQVAEDAPGASIAELESKLVELFMQVGTQGASLQRTIARLAALEAQHAPGHAHRANEPRAFGAVPDCVCGCSLDDHARDPQARSVVLGCEKCGACAKFRSAEVRYMEAKQ